MDIIRLMIVKFGGQLREELIDLIDRTSILRSCDGSIGSKNLSMDSFHPFIDLFQRNTST
jgi:hypothetical protein